jgi:hypothetical protein
MEKENATYIYKLFSDKDNQNYGIYRKVDGTGDHVKRNKSDLERQVLHIFSHMQNLDF